MYTGPTLPPAVVIGDNHTNSHGYRFIAENIDLLLAMGYRRFLIESADSTSETLRKYENSLEETALWKTRFGKDGWVTERSWVNEEGIHFMGSENKALMLRLIKVIKVHDPEMANNKGLGQLLTAFSCSRAVSDFIDLLKKAMQKDCEILCVKAVGIEANRDFRSHSYMETTDRFSSPKTCG